MRVTDFSPELDAWAGPFDLLCTVLLRRELPVTDIELATIAVDYVEALASDDSPINPDEVSEFLLLIAGLCEIKLRELLAIDQPADLPEPEPGETKEEMLQRLVRYQTFKGASGWFAERAERPHWWRVASRPTIRRSTTYDGPVQDPAQLARSLDVLLAAPNVDVRHLVGTHASVHDMTRQLLTLVLERRNVDFDEAFGSLNRLDQAVAFVAMLELARMGRIVIEQPDDFGSITIDPAANESSETADDGEPTETQIA